MAVNLQITFRNNQTLLH